MNYITTEIEGVYILEPKLFKDARGYFTETYNEEDIPNPKSVYGDTKYHGEEEVRRNPNHFITRISWVFGINGNNFVKTMLKL